MLLNADPRHADRFHILGRQLSTLKRLYEGYELLIERLLNGQKQHGDPSSRNDEHLLRRAETTFSRMPDSEMPLGATLTPAARVRFERSRDRIRLYALSEIQDCLDQIESLVKMVHTYQIMLVLQLILVTEFQPDSYKGKLFHRTIYKSCACTYKNNNTVLTRHSHVFLFLS